jgi:putative NADPH-quinone reductase
MLQRDLITGIRHSLSGITPRLSGLPGIGRREAAPCSAMSPLILNGHPDPSAERFCAALAAAAQRGALLAGYQPQIFTTGDIPLPAPGFITDCRFGEVYRAFRNANHLTIIFPLWLNQPPASLRAFMKCLSEASEKASAVRPAALPTRFIVTMEMPSCISAKSPVLAQALTLAGVHPTETLFIGGVHTISHERREDWLRSIATLH